MTIAAVLDAAQDAAAHVVGPVFESNSCPAIEKRVSKGIRRSGRRVSFHMVILPTVMQKNKRSGGRRY